MIGSTDRIILINKPLEWTSFDVVNKLKRPLLEEYKLLFPESERKQIKKYKVGHAGTLDPLATGLLVICTGKLTKTIQQIQDAEKELKSNKKAFLIGSFQVIAMIPGVSRSAATIIGGLTQRLNKKAAAEFSFFLAVPTMFAATIKDLYDYSKEGFSLDEHQILLLVIGNTIAFIVALLAIKSFVSYLTNHGFKVFGYYRIIVGLTILALYYLGIDLHFVS